MASLLGIIALELLVIIGLLLYMAFGTHTVHFNRD